MQKILTILLLLITASAFAQFQDNFSDGNLNQNPTWLGDTASFIVNQNNELQLNASSSGTSQIYVNAPTADSTVWEFYVNLDFAPSTSNQLKVYLSSNNSDLSASLNGYYILIGESGSNDAIELYRQDGSSSTMLIRGTDGFVSAEPVLIKVRVVRDENYNWSLLVDYTGGNNFALEGSTVDNTYTFGQFFGVKCKYTSTRVDKFYFDDFYIFPLYQDTDAPQISQIEVVSNNELTLTFNENLDVITATDISNYTVNNGIGNPNQAVLDANDDKIVRLTFVNNFQDATTNELTVSGVEDEAGNAIGLETINFQYVEVQTAGLYDIIINEIFADPTPSLSLPEVEFIEIYNRSTKNFNVENYTFSDASNDILLPNIVLQAGEYAIICDEDEVVQFTQYGKVIGVNNFPSLTNSGELLQLKNENDDLIDAVEYSSSWYQDSDKDDGGWTLERIYPNQPCLVGVDNWIVSEDLSGGTPAAENSVASANVDTESPILVRVFPESDTEIRLYFNKKLELNTAEDINNYRLSNGLNAMSAILEFPNQNTVLLMLSGSLQPSEIYMITIENTLTDCVSNSFSTIENTQDFAIPEPILPKDLLINEVLSNPGTGGSDFVEIYNISDKVLNLNDLQIGSANDGLVDELKPIDIEHLIFPNDYLVLTENSFDIISQYETPNPDGLIETDLPSYPDDEGGVVLVSNGEIIDQFNYSEDLHAELLDDKNGVSLERISFTADTQDENNWHSAASTVGYATPTYLNSQAIANSNSADNFWLEKTTFSPDDDGFEDLLLLNYQLDAPDYMATIRIFDANGRQLNTLINNQLLGNNGVIKWQGTTDEQVKAKVGIYILHIQLFNANGTVEEIQKTCVLAGKF
ncbi:MAG: lamin tail domain-containing protein [Saprospiraceae bacterium]